MVKNDTIRVTIRVPSDIYDVIKGSCTRIKVIDNKEVKRVISLNDAFVEFLWRGIETTEDDDEKNPV